ncbi:MAG TPA: hypothetical protein VFF14_10015 [Candidatus Deferrimicrobium sp.]|nr:hypothetical protein [Candidatus Deferrimicrobium sp.]
MALLDVETFWVVDTTLACIGAETLFSFSLVPVFVDKTDPLVNKELPTVGAGVTEVPMVMQRTEDNNNIKNLFILYPF